MPTGAARSGSIWWWTILLLIGVPALCLAVLGLRTVRLDRIEWEQQTAEREQQTARLVDLELDHALKAIEVAESQSEMRRATSSRSPDPYSAQSFSIDTEGTVTFVREQVYIADAAATSMPPSFAPLTAAAMHLVSLAQAAEAQGRYVDARAYIRRLNREVPLLTDWVRWTIAKVAYYEGDPAALRTLSDRTWSQSTGRTPGGLPVALVAAAFAVTVSAVERPHFRTLVQDTIDALRAGTWLLSIDERRFYENELTQWFGSLPTAAVSVARQFDDLETLATLIRRMGPAGPAATRVAASLGEHVLLLLWSERGASVSSRHGTLLSSSDLNTIGNHIIRPLSANAAFTLVVRDSSGRRVWSATTNPSTEGRTYTMRSVPGWDLTIASLGEPAALSVRRLFWLGLILMLVVMLGTGLVSAAHARQQELALARRQADFVAAVSHEFKSPLTSIRLHIERLASGRASPSEAAKYYGALEQDANRLERLVNRLLDSQQVQEGRKAYAFEPASIAAAAEVAVARLRPQADAKDIRLDLRNEDAGADARFDPAAITDVIENLVENAIKYSRAGSVVSIATRGDDDGVHVRIEDRGIGIDADDLPRIFDKFFRGRRGDAADVRGTGLGLSLVKAIVDGHGGSISVASVAGTGSTFSVTLPRQPNITRPA